MFGFSKRAKRQTELSKALAKHRLESRGELSLLQSRDIDSIGRLGALSLPEADIVVIVEAAIEGHKRGVPLANVLKHQEAMRKLSGSKPLIFSGIIEDAMGSNAAGALVDYCRYRNHVLSEKKPEAFLEPYEIEEMVAMAYSEITSW